MNLLWTVYLAGVLVGLWLGDSRPPVRVGLALLWPLGPIAFVVTIAGLLLASLIAFPLVGVIAGVLAAIVWLMVG
jgi:hypothetical protein